MVGEGAEESGGGSDVPVFNLEPGERLCFLCWDSCAFLGFVQEEGEEGVGEVGR